jgi:hypothetical protein
LLSPQNSALENLERWPSGRRRTPAKRVYLKRVPRVRIPLSPPVSAPVAQLDRAPDYGSGGWGFKSLRARQIFPPVGFSFPRGSPGSRSSRRGKKLHLHQAKKYVPAFVANRPAWKFNYLENYFPGMEHAFCSIRKGQLCWAKSYGATCCDSEFDFSFGLTTTICVAIGPRCKQNSESRMQKSKFGR